MSHVSQKAQTQKAPKGGNGYPTQVEEKAPTEQRPAPTIEQVSNWTKDDLRAAIAFLNIIYANPHIMDAVCGLIYEKAKGFDQNQQELKTVQDAGK